MGISAPVAISVLMVLTGCSFAGFRRVAVTKDIVSRPDPLAHSNAGPVPYLGGPALFAPLLPLLFLFASREPAMPGDRPGARWFCTACMLAVGLFDDIHPLSAAHKLVAQSVVCAVYLVAVTPPSSPHIWRSGLELALMLLVVNAFNLVDVMDGLLIVLASIAAIGLLGGAFLASPLNRFECWALLAGLGVAFLFNRPPARIYLGDAGALALGFFLVSLYLTGASNVSRGTGTVHLFAFALPIFESAFLTVARLHQGLSPFRGSPDHVSLRLKDQAGWSRGKVLAVTAMVGLFFDLWCYIPADAVLEPAGLILAAASIVVTIAASLSCWRLAPRQPDLR